MPMNNATRLARHVQAIALVGLPLIWLLMFALHFRSVSDVFVYHDHYVPVPAATTVTGLIEARNRWPMLHDPHQLGYLSLPLVVLMAFGLRAAAAGTRPILAQLGVAITVTGTIYLGGVFGLFTALMRGLGDVDAQHAVGAAAVFAAVTADHGAYGLTRGLAQLSMCGLMVQAASLWRVPHIPPWSPIALFIGAALFLRYWDVDNMMLLAALCLLVAFIPVARELWRAAGGASPQGPATS